MKRLLSVVSVMVFLAGAAFAKPPAKVSAQNVQPFPGTLINARYVYVTGYDGNEFNSNICLRTGTPSTPCRTPCRNGVNSFWSTIQNRLTLS